MKIALTMERAVELAQCFNDLYDASPGKFAPSTHTSATWNETDGRAELQHWNQGYCVSTDLTEGEASSSLEHDKRISLL